MRLHVRLTNYHGGQRRLSRTAWPDEPDRPGLLGGGACSVDPEKFECPLFLCFARRIPILNSRNCPRNVDLRLLVLRLPVETVDKVSEGWNM